MKVGDLVKVYHYTRKIRESGRYSDCDDHFVGLIVKGNGDPKYGHYREVLRCCDGETDFYNVSRLEVISGIA